MGKKIDVGKRIKAVNKKWDKQAMKYQGSGYRDVVCQGCGEKLDPDVSTEGIEYIKTKRGSEIFFHTDCMDKVWKSGIK